MLKIQATVDFSTAAFAATFAKKFSKHINATKNFFSTF